MPPDRLRYPRGGAGRVTLRRMPPHDAPAAYGLGRVHVPDDRDANYPLEASLRGDADRPWRYWYAGGWWGDQGARPHCVAYAWLHYLADGPHTTPEVDPVLEPDGLYREAQTVDQWPGENYDGTSVRAGAKILAGRGWISSYLWAWDADTVVRALLTAGPVVVGTSWHASMFRPDRDGIIHPDGNVVGGHAYLLNGANVRRGVVRLKNSWSRSWGDRGYAWLRIEDLDALIRDRGEACLATPSRPT